MMSSYIRPPRDASLALTHEELMREREALGLGPYAERRERERDPEPKPEPPKCQHCGRPVKPGETLCKRCPEGRMCQGDGCTVDLRGHDVRTKYCPACAETERRRMTREAQRRHRSQEAA